MTDQLTKKKGERCARACGWVGILKGNNLVWYYPGGEPVGLFDIGQFHDPYFWFPRLWQRLEELAVEKYGDDCHVYVQRDELDRLTYQAGAEEWGSADASGQGDSPCLALCTAIENLKAKG